MAWPAVPGREGAALGPILLQLEQSQWWPAKRLQQMQFRQITQLCRFAVRRVPFYRERLAAHGWRPGGPMTPALWRELPILTRDEIQQAGELLHGTDLPETHGAVARSVTSGTSGKPIACLASALVGTFWRAFTLRDHFWHRRNISAKLAALRSGDEGHAPYPDGHKQRTWGGAFEGLLRSGPSVALNIHCSPEEKIEWLQRQAPSYLIAFPSVVEELALVCLEKNIALPSLKGVTTVSENLTSATRALCRQAWDIAVTDIYSARETGYLALQCPETECYHLQSESALIEVLRADDRPCAPGETGRVIITPLHNFAMPLLRYDLGDEAEVGAPCSCGRGLPVLTRILGRQRDRIRLPGGGTRWSNQSHADVQRLQALAPLRRYQLVQTSLEEAEVRLVAARELDPGEEEIVKSVARNILGHPFAIRITYFDEIPRNPSGKFQPFVQAMDQGSGQ